MLHVARTPDQIAAATGHEIDHGLADHSNERLARDLAVLGGLMLVELLVEEAVKLGHELLRKALGLGARSGVLLPYRRTHESEAELIGLELTAKAGGDPRACIALWRNMAAAGDGQPLAFLSTHPSHERRQEELGNGMDSALALQLEARQQGRSPSCRL